MILVALKPPVIIITKISSCKKLLSADKQAKKLGNLKFELLEAKANLRSLAKSVILVYKIEQGSTLCGKVNWYFL